MRDGQRAPGPRGGEHAGGAGARRSGRRRGGGRAPPTRWPRTTSRSPKCTAIAAWAVRRRRPRAPRSRTRSATGRSWRRRGLVPARCCWSPRGRSRTSRSRWRRSRRSRRLLTGARHDGRRVRAGGQRSPAAEANIWVDPEAAQAVFRGVRGRRAPAARLRGPRCHRTGPDDARGRGRGLRAGTVDSPARAVRARTRSRSTSSSTSAPGPWTAPPCTTRWRWPSPSIPSLVRSSARRGCEVESDGTVDPGHDGDGPGRRAAERRAGAWPDRRERPRSAGRGRGPTFTARFIRPAPRSSCGRARERAAPTSSSIGAINVDLVVAGAALPGPGETVVGGTFAQQHGGKGGTRRWRRRGRRRRRAGWHGRRGGR